MDKKLKCYLSYIDKAAKHPSKELIAFHRDELRQFQHERFIHLIVTMFFALFMVIFFVLFLVLGLSELSNGPSGKLVLACCGGLTVVLLIVTLFYVRHYYQLENGTQKLEEYTSKLHEHDYCRKK